MKTTPLMKAKHLADARERASVYAPEPVGSYLTYGFVGLSLVGFALAFLSGFYGIDLLRQPLGLIALGVIATLAGFVVRKLWKRKHYSAVAAEYAKSAREISNNPPLTGAE